MISSSSSIEPVVIYFQQVDRWNQLDVNIQLTAGISSRVNFLDLQIENKDGTLVTSVYHKPSDEPYYLPFNNIHPVHMKRNMPFAMFLRAIRYCSTLQGYLNERGKLRMALLVNQYSVKFIDQQFNQVLRKFSIDTPYEERVPVDYGRKLFVHFTYCSNMATFPRKLHSLWNKYFEQSPISEVSPIFRTRNVENLQWRLVHTRHT